ncbi:flagellin N-terminal helical domain-containing protein [Massilia antarctica]|uniref:flagellin N-terminal helical domain-containing protein n=1 Tax=Massilia antarctica TaxID=2765360 RepID=UPI0006BB859D|nr:flagellin [Massilia sp. H27-R4]MCY0911420.1 flagellin [Massilia sp. H27-R4]CUI04978.1 Flagellin protein FlaB [Janthinobacterium sp. CG23_2]CUU28764.1 Flagellin protein FlaB [Janthinobacterium sp. CG23_2]
MSVINTNTASLNAQRNLSTSASALSTSLQRLSSGLRINSAKDDAAGLAISERFTSQIRGLDQAKRNANDGVSMLQTAEGSLQSTGNILQRVRELSVQSSNATNSAGDRKAIQAEVGQLLSEADRIAQTSEFNGLKLLDGSFGTATFQVGANAGQTIQATTANFRTNNYGNNEASTAAPTTLATTGTAYTAGSFALQGLATSNIAVAATDTAQSLASTINGATANTGVTAEAKTEEAVTLAAGGVYSLGVTSDNSTAANVTFTVGAALNASGLASAVSSFNDVSSKTGVTAKLNSTNDGLVLTNAAGNNITLANNSASASVTAGAISAAGTVGTTAAVATGATSTSMGYVSMNSDKGFSVGSSGSTAIAAGTAASLNTVSGIDVSTAKGASNALKVLDSALANVNSQRASFGALQSRFETAVTNLESTSENLSASRSRIQDTDFASETAKLTRGQILQQAGTAMLAQANSLPNGVLSLLRG